MKSIVLCDNGKIEKVLPPCEKYHFNTLILRYKIAIILSYL